MYICALWLPRFYGQPHKGTLANRQQKWTNKLKDANKWRRKWRQRRLEK